MSKARFIAVAGNIGVGKSTLTRMLSESFGWEPFLEANAENPYLSDFYQDMERWSFHSQVFFLGKRLEHHRLLTMHPGSAVQDRTVYEDAEIFARNLHQQGQLSQREYETYHSLYRAIASFLPPPDLVIYLEASVETLLDHIARRGRDYERNIDPAYLARLNRLYEDWIGDWTICPVLRIPVNGVDFQNNAAHYAEILTRVQDSLRQHSH